MCVSSVIFDEGLSSPFSKKNPFLQPYGLKFQFLLSLNQQLTTELLAQSEFATHSERRKNCIHSKMKLKVAVASCKRRKEFCKNEILDG